MTPRNIRFRTCLQLMRWSAPTLAEALGCSTALARRWAGEGPEAPLEPPGVVLLWLEEVAMAIRRRPPPQPPQWRGPRHPHSRGRAVPR